MTSKKGVLKVEHRSHCGKEVRRRSNLAMSKHRLVCFAAAYGGRYSSSKWGVYWCLSTFWGTLFTM